MKIRINNLGPIKDSIVEFNKPLTILTGFNNTGKSYLTYLLYGVLNLNKSKYQRNFYSIENFSKSIFNEFKSKRLKVVKKSYKTKHIIDICKTHEVNYEKLLNLLKKDLNKLTIEFFSSVNVNLDFEIILEKKKEYKQDEIVKFSFEKNSLYYILKNNLRRKRIRFTSKATNKQKWDVILQEISIVLSYDLISEFSDANVFFLPAERTALSLASKDITREKSLDRDEIAQKILAGEDLNKLTKTLKRRILPRYPLALSDFIYFSNDLSQISKLKSKFNFLAEEIEKRMLEGRIEVNELGDITFKTFKDKILLDLQVSSSLVKSLASLIVYLRHVAIRNDLIIIDEPELNLHPRNQILLARIIGILINNGIKIVLSTHSDYIIREINNLLILGQNARKTKKFIQLYNYNKQEFLTNKDVKFLQIENGYVNELKNHEYGIKVLHIDKEINMQNVITNDIRNSLVDNDDK